MSSSELNMQPGSTRSHVSCLPTENVSRLFRSTLMGRQKQVLSGTGTKRMRKVLSI